MMNAITKRIAAMTASMCVAPFSAPDKQRRRQLPRTLPFIPRSKRSGVGEPAGTAGRVRSVSLIALVTWIMAAAAGLYLLSIWLIEYDKDFQAVAATRLPPPVLAAHVSLAGGGLVLWIYYLFYDNDDLGWISAGAVCAAAVFGVVMANGWFSVYRAKRASIRLDRTADGPLGPVAGLHPPAYSRGKAPQRNDPLPVVIARGAVTAAKLTLVLHAI